MHAALMPTYSPPDLVFTHGRGSYIYADNGKQYLDFITGIAVNTFGHAHPYLVNALQKQAEKLWHTSNLFRIQDGERLANRLVEHTFADKIFFANSGAEAVECGLKMMRRYHFDKGHPERVRIIGTSGSFHGRTIATIAAAGNPTYTKGFLAGDAGFDHVTFCDLDALQKAITPETAGIILEPIQGEGGIFPASIEYLQNIRKLCDQHGILLMLDEVQCGNGRTGKLYAYQWTDIKPDILATAKGLGGGFPVSACMATAAAAAAMVVGTHGSTFGGNPMAMAVANAVLDLLLEDGFLAQIETRGNLLRAQLQALINRYPELLLEVRGKGLMLGLKCKVENTKLLEKLREAGLLTGKAGDNVIRLLPPLNVSEAEIKEAMGKFEQVCSSWPK